MSQVTTGIVKGGKIEPAIPLPEGATVQIVVLGPFSDIDPELQAEFEAWNQASLNALELVERLANEEPDNAKG